MAIAPMFFLNYVKHFGMEVRLKNHTDVLIFQLRVCAGATNSRSQSQI